MVVFDPRYEDPKMCEIRHRCRLDECGRDIYFLPGWDGTLPMVSGDRGDRIDDYAKKYFNDHDVYVCQNLPTFENYHDYKKDAHDLVKAIDGNGDEPIILVGASYGGMVAQYVASQYPEKIEKLGLLFSFDEVPYDDVLEITEDDIVDLSSRTMALRPTQFALEIITEYSGAGTPKDVVNFFKLDEAENNKNIKAKTFVLNCPTDGFLGMLPRIDGSVNRIKSPCIHHRMDEVDVKTLSDFINDD